MSEFSFKNLEGKTLSSVEKIKNNVLIFKTEDGLKFAMYHEQDCCERVYLETCSELNDILKSEIVKAEISSSRKREDWGDVCQWTFYRITTKDGGFASLRWYGESNGYYSTSVSFCQLKEGEDLPYGLTL